MKKLAAILELNYQELKYLLHGISNLDKHYLSDPRDYTREDLAEKLKNKLEKALTNVEKN